MLSCRHPATWLTHLLTMLSSPTRRYALWEWRPGGVCLLSVSRTPCLLPSTRSKEKTWEASSEEVMGYFMGEELFKGWALEKARVKPSQNWHGSDYWELNKLFWDLRSKESADPLAGAHCWGYLTHINPLTQKACRNDKVLHWQLVIIPAIFPYPPTHPFLSYKGGRAWLLGFMLKETGAWR